jgi:hypothetical protein
MSVLDFKKGSLAEFQRYHARRYRLIMHWRRFESNLGWDARELNAFGFVASLIEEAYHNPVCLSEFDASFAGLCTLISHHSVSFCIAAKSTIHGQLLPNIVHVLCCDTIPPALMCHALDIANALVQHSGDDLIRETLLESRVADYLFIYFTADDPCIIHSLAPFFHDLLLHCTEFRREFLDSGQFHRFFEILYEQSDSALVSEFFYLPALFANPVCTFPNLTADEILEVLRLVLASFQVYVNFGLGQDFVGLVSSFLCHNDRNYLNPFYFENRYVATLMDIFRVLIEGISEQTINDELFLREFRSVSHAVVKVIRKAPESLELSIVPFFLLLPLLSLFDHAKMCKGIWRIVNAAVEFGGGAFIEQLYDGGVFYMILEHISDFGFTLKSTVLEFCTHVLHHSTDDQFLRLINDFGLLDLVLSHFDTTDASHVHSVWCVFDRIFKNSEWLEMIEARREQLDEIMAECDANGLDTIGIPTNEALCCCD